MRWMTTGVRKASRSLTIPTRAATNRLVFRHFMDLAKAYKKQAAHESKIHIQSFTSAMDIKAVSFTDLVDAKVKNM